MCRSIHTLRKPEGRASEQEINEAAVQFVRKVSGYYKPSRVNQPAFDAAVAEVAEATAKLLESLKVHAITLQMPIPHKAAPTHTKTSEF
jgi:hypothetical protein